MHSRTKIAWGAVRDSLWFVPSVITLFAAILGSVLVQLERNGTIAIGTKEHFLLGGGPDGAQAVLSAIATGLMTVTGVVFSVTVVALQLASSEFTPRVLRNFTADKANQYVLGILIGTFTYSIVVLRAIEAGETEPFVPRASVAVALVLGLACVALLIYYINHTARAIQIPMILKRAGDRGLAQVEDLFPEDFGEPDNALPEEIEVPQEHVAIAAPRSGYIQAIDADNMFDLSRSSEVVVYMDHRLGDYVLRGQPLARAWPREHVDDRFVRGLQNAFVVGPERTPDQDYELVLIEVSDIAVKALSPGINDPTTAQHCIDQLADLLLVLARRHAPTHIRTEDGRLHVVVKDLPFDVAVDSAFSPIIHFGATNPAIRMRLIERLTTLTELVPSRRRAPLEQMLAHVRSIAPRTTAS